MSKKTKKTGLSAIYIIVLFPVFLMSCIGSSSQIKINNDGSGTIKQEYRISNMLQSMGKTDGNENDLPLPVGKEDLERTVERIPGLSLVSFSQRQDDKDLIISFEMAFATPEALAAFMEDDNLQMKMDMKKKTFSLHLPAGEDGEESFKDMMTSAFLGYDFSFSITVPGRAKTTWLDEKGKKVQKYPGTCSVRNSIVEYTAPMGDLVYLAAPLVLEISW